MNTLADRLRLRRTELGLSKNQLARNVGMDHSVVVRMEQGHTKYSRFLFDISDELRVNVDWLVRGRSDKEIKTVLTPIAAIGFNILIGCYIL